MRKKRTKSTGGFGARHGRKVRKVVESVERDKFYRYTCPNCGGVSIKRKGSGIWKCTKCGLVSAGGAYKPQTAMGKSASVIRTSNK